MDRIYKGKSLTTIFNDYTIIDVETTGLYPGFDEIIEFAALKIRNGIIIDKYTTLIKPDREIDSFITELTGITNEMLSIAPCINSKIDEIIAFIGNDIVIGHNVNFDINFIYDIYEYERNKYLKNDFIDTLRLSKKLFKNIPNYQLSTLASLFNKKYFPSHRAINDCLATQELIQYIYNYIIENNLDLNTLFTKSYTNNKRLNPKTIIANTEDIDEDNPLFGLSVCFTSTLDKMVRKDALQLVANLGGIPMDSVTKATNLLVLGDMDYRTNKKIHKSNKYKKAESLILSGYNLKIISETVFLDMIDDEIEKDYYRL